MKLFLDKSIAIDLMQWIGTLTVFMLSMQMGIFYGWTSPNTARLLSEDSPIPCTTSDISWLVALAPIGCVLGAIIASMLVEYIGARKTAGISYSKMGISWICILIAYCTSSIGWLFAARFFGGLVTTMLYCCCPIYLSEISSANIRGTLVSLGLAGGTFGCLFGIIAETYVDQKVTALIYLSMVLIGLAMLLYLKDSSYFLVKKGDLESAKKSIMFYRKDINVDDELKEIQIFIQKNSNGIRNKISQLRKPETQRAMLIIIIVFALPDACGFLTILSYTEMILKTSGFDYIEPEQWVIYSYTINLVFSFLTVRVLDKFGRKVAIIISSIGTALALFAIGLHFYFLKSGVDMQNFQWIIVISLLLFTITFQIGYYVVPSTLLSEMFPDNIKSIASLVGSLTASICAFTAVKSYQPIADSIGEEYLFWIHAIISLTGVPLALFLLIETKGKTFQEIQDILAKK